MGDGKFVMEITEQGTQPPEFYILFDQEAIRKRKCGQSSWDEQRGGSPECEI
jgi:hypothetical protein